MKKFILTIAILAAAATSAFAQNLSVSAGYLNSTQKTSNNSTVSNGFYGGVGAEMALGSSFGIATGLYYSYLTTSASATESVVTVSGKTNEHYFTVPVHLTAGYSVSKDLRLFIEVGPAANVGLASKTSGSVSVLGFSVNADGDNYGEDSTYTRFDVLLGGLAGIQFKNFKIFGGYNYGLLDRNSSDSIKLNRSEIIAGIALCL